MGLALAVTVALAVPVAGHATPLMRAQTGTGVTNGIGDSQTVLNNSLTTASASSLSAYDCSAADGVGSIPGACSAQNGSVAQRARASATAEVGAVHASVATVATVGVAVGNNPNAQKAANAQATAAAHGVSFNDAFTINVPGLNGTSGTFVGTIHANGTVSFGSFPLTSGHVSWAWHAGLTGGGSVSDSGLYTEAGNGVTLSGSALPTDKPIVAQFVFGSPITLDLTIDLSSESDAGFTTPFDPAPVTTYGASFGADFSNTVAWGGIVSLADANGTPISLSSVTLTSSSGFDYLLGYQSPTQSAPEPATLLLLSVGFAGLRAIRRR